MEFCGSIGGGRVYCLVGFKLEFLVVFRVRDSIIVVFAFFFYFGDGDFRSDRGRGFFEFI